MNETQMNPYSFSPFIETIQGIDFYRDDPFLQQLVKQYAGDDWLQLHEKLLAFSPKVSYEWRDLASEAARPEFRPFLEHYDAHNNRIDRIVRCGETKMLEKGIFGEALFSTRTSPWEQFTKRLMLQELGEIGVLCPIACTEGLIALIEAFPENRHPEVEKILLHCKEGIRGEFGIGAQFITEIQGGSDIPANVLEAHPQGDHYKLYGNKFFCSAMHADYSVVTAKVKGTDQIGTFVVPSWLGDKKLQKRNGYRINRLKWKLGTVELPTAEVDYDGAVAYAVGPVDRGVANVVGIVLTLSRIAVGVSSAASMLRAAREASIYSEFREAFGQKISEFPLAAKQVKDVIQAAQRTTAGNFKIYDLHLRLGKRLQGGLASNTSREQKKEQFNLRELIIIQKMVTAYEAVDVIRKAISLFGGHGVIEDFSSLPRLLRDATVNELWEGPRNVLLMQIFRDLDRVKAWYPPEEFVSSILEGVSKEIVEEFAEMLREFLDNPPFFQRDEVSTERAGTWETFWDRLFRVYQERALDEVGAVPIIAAEKIAAHSAPLDEPIPEITRKRQIGG
jgi:alkylation response protein AidB-like acyl-CoA dehydrogenase